MTPTHVMLHHSLTKDSETVSWGAIRRYHTDTNGWAGIGYHAGVELVSSGGAATYEVLLGRPWTENGAHCPQEGMNRKALGICLVGNFDEMLVPRPQWEKAVELVRMLCAIYAIPTEHIVGHRDYNPIKTCPGEMFSVEALRADVERGMDGER